MAAAEDRARSELLGRFFSRVEPRGHADVYVVRRLPQEIRATLNGLYSRSRLSMRETFLRRLEQGLAQQGKTLADLPIDTGASDEEVLSRVLVEKAGSFLRTYAIDHGHNSLREGAVVHLAVENVSQLVTRFLQRERRASFEESSTRYISFSREGHWRDPGLVASGGDEARLYEECIAESFGFYLEACDLLREHLLTTRPCAEDDDPKAWERAARAEAFDSARYLLLPALHTKFGMIADARTIADMVTRLLSHPLEEFRVVGQRIREEAETEVPTLLAHARDDAWLRGERDARRAAADEVSGTTEPDPEARIPEGGIEVRLLDAPDDADERLLASWLWEDAGEPYEALLARIRGMSRGDLEKLFERALAARGPRDAMPEGMEGAGSCSFELLVDFGAYRDIGRHRKGFQAQQRLTTALGFCVPPLFDEAGLGDRYREVLRSVGAKARRIAVRHPDAASYVIPFAYRQRIRLDFDLRQMAYFLELRSAPEGHFSYREVAIRMADELVRVAPLYEDWIRTCRERVLLGRVEAERGRDERRRAREERARQAGFET